jgi:hypothetical protein
MTHRMDDQLQGPSPDTGAFLAQRLPDPLREERPQSTGQDTGQIVALPQRLPAELQKRKTFARPLHSHCSI